MTVQAKGLTSQISALRNRLELLDLEYRSIQTIIDSPSLESLLPLPPLPQVEDSDFYADMIAARNQTLQLRSQINQLTIRLQSMNKSFELQSKIAEDMRPLFEAGGLARNSYLVQLNKLQELKASIATVEGERSRILGISATRQDAINKEQLSLNAQLVSSLEQLSYRTLTAPVSGKIFDVQVSDKSVVSSSEPLLKIVPSKALQASVDILDSDIGFVRVGLPVSVSVDSFPSGEFGYINGRLETIGLDALPPSPEIPQRHFPALISLTQQTVESGDSNLNLQSGMSITANIKLRSRRAITLLTDIFTRQLDGVKRFR